MDNLIVFSGIALFFIIWGTIDYFKQKGKQ